MKGYIQVTATKEQIEHIQDFYDSLDNYLSLPKKIKGLSSMAQRPVHQGAYIYTFPRTLTIFKYECLEQRDNFYFFLKIFKQLKTGKTVNMDQHAYDTCSMILGMDKFYEDAT